MFVLRLNDMRFPKIEMLANVAKADTREALESLLVTEHCESYSDDGWGKCYRKGGPLEWFNPPEFGGGIISIGTEDDAAIEGVYRWRRFVSGIPSIEELTAGATHAL